MKQKAYHSINEFERKFFPKHYKEKLKEEQMKDPKKYGTTLATELLKNIKRQLRGLYEF